VLIEESDDPVVVGKEITYRITVSNDARESDQRIGIVIEKPAEFGDVTIRGTPPATVDATRIVIPTVAELRGREQLLPIELRVKPSKPGMYQLKVQVRSARVPDGVVVSEDTRVVAEERYNTCNSFRPLHHRSRKERP
jgi:hypothetical protein